jgi:hypothetical protein
MALSHAQSRRRSKRRYVPTTNLTADQIVNAPVEYRSLEIRTVAPALVFVIEKDAPPRMEMIADTHGEALVVQELVRADPVAGEFVDIYFGEKAAGDFVREDAYAERLEAGHPIGGSR